MKHRDTAKITIGNPITINYRDLIIAEKFVASDVRWVRCVDKRDDNYYFTESEIRKILMKG